VIDEDEDPAELGMDGDLGLLPILEVVLEKLVKVSSDRIVLGIAHVPNVDVSGETSSELCHP
jgi:hypothetical protein